MTRRQFGAVVAGFIALVGLVALVYELATSLAEGRTVLDALYRHLRFFTILTNWGIAALLAATAAQALRGRPLPPSRFYGAALVYILVVGVTYELLLRKTGIRHDAGFFSDMILHDVVPSFYLAFWLGFAPKAGLRWRDAVRWLAYPAAYFAMTLAAGAAGAGYPYFFVDAGRFGYAAVATNACLFLLAFLLLGLGVVLISRVVPRGIDTRESLAAPPS